MFQESDILAYRLDTAVRGSSGRGASVANSILTPRKTNWRAGLALQYLADQVEALRRDSLSPDKSGIQNETCS